jgi:hypothetical protein
MQFRTPLAEIRYYLTTAVQGVPTSTGAGKIQGSSLLT